jgi:hypothetical protein
LYVIRRDSSTQIRPAPQRVEIDDEEIPRVMALVVGCPERQTLQRRVAPSDSGETHAGFAGRVEITQLVADIQQMPRFDATLTDLLPQRPGLSEQTRPSDDDIEARETMSPDIIPHARARVRRHHTQPVTALEKDLQDVPDPVDRRRVHQVTPHGTTHPRCQLRHPV